MIIQLFIIVAIVIIIIFLLSAKQTHAFQAYKKIAILLVAFAMIMAVLLPDTTNNVAHFVGVGRGADLLLYVLAISFFVFVINHYIQKQKEKEIVQKLARKIALADANQRYGIKDLNIH